MHANLRRAETGGWYHILSLLRPKAAGDPEIEEAVRLLELWRREETSFHADASLKDAPDQLEKFKERDGLRKLILPGTTRYILPLMVAIEHCINY